MAVLRNYERYIQTSAWVLGGIDLFAAARTTKKEVPPILGEVNFFITRRLTPPVAVYDPPLEFISTTNPSGYFLFPGEVRKPDRAGTMMLGPGQYRWRVESDYYQTIDFTEVWPPPEVENKTLYDKAKDLRFVPGPSYPFPEFLLAQRDLAVTLVRGSLLTAGGSPIEGVEVELTAPELGPRYEGFLSCKTDRRGDWVISFVEKVRPEPMDELPKLDESKIHVNLPAGGAYDIDLAITPSTENAVRQTALRGRVVKPGGIGLSNVKVTTSVAAGESRSKADGQWFFYFELRQAGGAVTVTALSPDGLTKNAQTQIEPRTTSVVPAIELS
ncbi:MAG: hypothetical protein AABN95_03570 [Acidobacteriota bacterium]